MSRGGRGGGRGGRGGMHRNPLPFDVDQEIMEEAQGSTNDHGLTQDQIRQLFPPRDDIVAPRPITAKEMKIVDARIERYRNRKKSKHWSGTKEDWDREDGAKAAKRPIDAFDSMETYSKKKRAKTDDWVPLEKRKFNTPKWLLPKILWSSDEEDDEGDKKKKTAPKKTVGDKLANLKDGKEGKDGEGDDEDEENEDGAAKDADNDDAVSEPQDSEYEEDEADDADNDYNAENYFSGGEDDGSVGDDGGDEGDYGYFQPETRAPDLRDHGLIEEDPFDLRKYMNKHVFHAARE